MCSARSTARCTASSSCSKILILPQRMPKAGSPSPMFRPGYIASKPRTRDLKSRYAGLASDTRLRRVLQHDDPKTLEFLLQELLDEFDADAAVFTPGTERPAVGAQREGQPVWSDLQPPFTPSVTQALK